jgi:nucleoside-diphosphate-sugar epimerase
MKVLVMGGSRFNGLAVVEDLLREGHTVTTFNRGMSNTDLPRGVRQLYGDRKDHEALRATLGNEDFDVIQDTSAYVLEDVQSMFEIFNGRIGHYIFASSAAAYDHDYKMLPVTEDYPLNWSEDASNNYGRNKAICETYLIEAYRKAGFPASIVRYPMVYGPRNNNANREGLMFTRLLMGRPILIPGDGTTLGHLSYVRDQAVSQRKMMLNPRTFGQAYNLAARDYYSDEGYVDTLADIVGVKPEKVFLPHDIAEEAYESMPYPIIQRHGVRLVHWTRSSVFSTRKFEEHVGYAQEHSFLAGMTETFEWYQREGIRDRGEFDFSHEDRLLERVRGR